MEYLQDAISWNYAQSAKGTLDRFRNCRTCQ